MKSCRIYRSLILNLLIQLKDHLCRAKPFGNSHRNYSMLLVPVAEGNVSFLEDLGIPQLFDLADVSTNGGRFFGTLLPIIRIISIDTLRSFLIRLACREPLDLLRYSSHMVVRPGMRISPYFIIFFFVICFCKKPETTA